MRTVRVVRFIARAIFASLVFVAVGSGTAVAERAFPTPTAAEFLADPGQLLKQYPNGGARLTALVQQIALTDPSTFKALIGLVANANSLQKAAIGEGLAQAAKIEILTNQALAEEWQDQIAAIDDPSFKAAATAAFGDVKLGAVGGGPLGGGGGGPSRPGATYTGAPADIRARPVPTPQSTITASTSAGPSFTLRLITTDASSPVSP
jgi:hypothetical protein